jgi:two-component system NtrC family sensor kinase
MLSRNILKYGITVEMILESQDKPMLIRSQQISQVLINLITNAAHAMENKGTLTVSTSFQDGMAFLTIDDTGPGIPPEKLETIWEPFFTTKAEDVGTGLGLSICKDIVALHDGHITVENGSGGGARFIIALPVSHSD